MFDDTIDYQLQLKCIIVIGYDYHFSFFEKAKYLALQKERTVFTNGQIDKRKDETSDMVTFKERFVCLQILSVTFILLKHVSSSSGSNSGIFDPSSVL